MCGAVLLFACNDAVREISQRPHAHRAGRVGALHGGVRARAVHVQSDQAPAGHAHHAAVAAARPLDAAARLDRAQFLRAALSAARPGAGDHLLHAVHRGGARRPDPRRMDRLAALDRDHRSASAACCWWRGRARAASIRRRCSRSGAAVCYAVYSISTRILARTDSNETTIFYSNLVGAVAGHQSRCRSSGRRRAIRLVIVLMCSMGLFSGARALSADRRPPPRARLACWRRSSTPRSSG